MNGYIYTMFAGADPGHGWVMNDPIFGKTPTLGACVPNIRRAVELGDYIFVVSGRVQGERQFVIGGFQVQDKLNALAAYKKYPENRLRIGEDGNVRGNIIVNSRGEHHHLDEHDNFERRIENYIVGGNPVVLESPRQFSAAREDTLDVLSEVFGKKGPRVFDIIGRQHRMDPKQVEQMLAWLKSITD